MSAQCLHMLTYSMSPNSAPRTSDRKVRCTPPTPPPPSPTPPQSTFSLRSSQGIRVQSHASASGYSLVPNPSLAFASRHWQPLGTRTLHTLVRMGSAVLSPCITVSTRAKAKAAVGLSPSRYRGNIPVNFFFFNGRRVGVGAGSFTTAVSLA